MKRIVFTGGGTGGHIVPNLAIMQELKSQLANVEILYIGSKKGPEALMVPKAGIEYKGILTGKLRRYFSFQNLIDFFKIPIGIFQAYMILKKFKPNVVFSKGGFVSIPVTYAAHFLKIPIVLHESDASPGLANKLGAKKATVICLAYMESKKYFPERIKMVYTENPVRKMIFNGDKNRGYKLCGFTGDKPVILAMGGSQGAQHVNEVIFKAAEKLTEDFQIIHICGKGKLPKENPVSRKNLYKPFEYLDAELADVYAITDLVISRAGANSIAEIDALGFLSVLVPIGSKASRGEQSLNAELYNKNNPNTSRVIPNDELDSEKLINAVVELMRHKKTNNEASSKAKNAASTKIVEVLAEYLV